MIALDLDFTLWSDFVENTLPPYTRVEGMEGHIISCSDRVNGGTVRLLSLYNDVYEILNWCKAQNLTLTICSCLRDAKYAKTILSSLDMWDMFTCPQIFRSRKTYHFRNLSDIAGCSYDSFLFFDDCQQNVKACSSLGVTSCQIDKAIGLDWSTFVKGLEMFSMSRQVSPDSVAMSFFEDCPATIGKRPRDDTCSAEKHDSKRASPVYVEPKTDSVGTEVDEEE